MRRAIAIALLLLASACGPEEADPGMDGAGALGVQDADGDGWYSDEECDDGAWDVFPGATEICDGIDNDCDGDVDEDVLRMYYADDDDDGYGDPHHNKLACDKPAGFVQHATDCDDTDPEVRPSAREICNGVDDDCNGVVDDDCEGAPAPPYEDGDTGWGGDTGT